MTAAMVGPNAAADKVNNPANPETAAKETSPNHSPMISDCIMVMDPMVRPNANIDRMLLDPIF